MTEQTTSAEGTDPRCRAGSATDNRCPRPATRTAWGDDGPPEICVFHSRLWELNDDLGSTRRRRKCSAFGTSRPG